MSVPCAGHKSQTHIGLSRSGLQGGLDGGGRGSLPGLDGGGRGSLPGLAGARYSTGRTRLTVFRASFRIRVVGQVVVGSKSR